jgi:hypothetical protein
MASLPSTAPTVRQFLIAWGRRNVSIEISSLVVGFSVPSERAFVVNVVNVTRFLGFISNCVDVGHSISNEF